jgi:hypothetical protein
MNTFGKIILGLFTGAAIFSGCSQKENETEAIFSETVKNPHGSLLLGEEYRQDAWTILNLDSLFAKGQGAFNVPTNATNGSTYQIYIADNKLIISCLLNKSILYVDKSDSDKDPIKITIPNLNLILKGHGRARVEF